MPQLIVLELKDSQRLDSSVRSCLSNDESRELTPYKLQIMLRVMIRRRILRYRCMQESRNPRLKD